MEKYDYSTLPDERRYGFAFLFKNFRSHIPILAHGNDCERKGIGAWKRRINKPVCTNEDGSILYKAYEKAVVQRQHMKTAREREQQHLMEKI